MAPDDDVHIVSIHLGPVFHVDMALDGRPYWRGSARPGTWSLVPAGQAPEALLEGSWEILHLYIPDALLHDVLGGTPASTWGSKLALKQPRFTLEPTLHRLGQAILDEMQAGQPLMEVAIEGLGLQLAAHLLRTCSSPEHAAAGPTLTAVQLRRTLDYLEASFRQDVPLHQLAALTGLSVFHFARAFRNSAGEPPHRWIVRRRMEEARRLLMETSRPVGDIAAEVGYADPSGFARKFRQTFGAAPRAFRSRLSTLDPQPSKK